MNFRLIKVLAAICVGLCLMVTAEWMYAIYTQKHLLENVATDKKPKKAVAELPTIELAKRPESSYTDLVSRPLFIQGRRPVSEPSSDKVPVTNAATETFNWELNGVYTYQNKLYALFSRTSAKVPKDNFRKVTKDNDIDGWKLIEINKDNVVVSQGDKQKELPLRKAKPKQAVDDGSNPQVPPPVPNQPGQVVAPPGQQVVPGQQLIPEPLPEPVPEQVLEPEQIIDESSEPYIENIENGQFQ